MKEGFMTSYQLFLIFFFINWTRAYEVDVLVQIFTANQLYSLLFTKMLIIALQIILLGVVFRPLTRSLYKIIFVLGNEIAFLGGRSIR